LEAAAIAAIRERGLDSECREQHCPRERGGAQQCAATSGESALMHENPRPSAAAFG